MEAVGAAADRPGVGESAAAAMLGADARCSCRGDRACIGEARAIAQIEANARCACRRDRAEVADAAAGSKINACGHADDCFAGVVGETAAGNIDTVGAAADRPAVGEAATGLHSERAGTCTIYR